MRGVALRISLMTAVLLVGALVVRSLPPSMAAASAQGSAASSSNAYVVNDTHFHLTNYVQEGTNIHDFLKIMGNKVGRVALFGIPLQQQWSHGNTGDFAPTYYLQTDAPLYYYSFTDAFIAMAYRSLTPTEQARFDPMITGFNPADMYAADHIRRVLTTFPGVFSGIGEFTIHKEFVSSKIAGETASLLNPALDRILDFAGEVGLVVLLHNDIDMPFPKPGQDPYQVVQLRDLFKRHPKTTIIWAHAGLGRIVRPVADQLGILERGLANPDSKNVHIDLSWDEVAKYVVASPETIKATAALITKHPDRFLFGTDEVAPTEQAKYLKVYDMYKPLFAALSPDVSEKFRKGNYERLFDEARRKVRAWEKANVR
jgi:predicted TIM-barrel fold metal-dependent hydrolase